MDSLWLADAARINEWCLIAKIYVYRNRKKNYAKLFKIG